MSDNPFGPLLGDLLSILGQQGPDAWYETARTLAANVARRDGGDANPDVAARQRVERIAPLVARHVDTIFSVAVNDDVTVINRMGLALAALEQWRPLAQPLVDLAANVPATEADVDAPAGLGQLLATFGPLFTGFQLGSVAGHFADRAWSLAALPLPRADGRASLVADNVAAFADAWSLDPDATVAFSLGREFAAAVILAQPGTGDALRALLRDSLRDAAAAQGDLLSRLESIVPEELTTLLGDPSRLLDDIDVPAATAATRAIDAATAALRAVFDAVAFVVTEQLVGPAPQLREAYRRHRLADAKGEDAAAALFGIDLRGPHQGTADAFVAEVVAAEELAGFTPLLRADGLPTDHELLVPQDWRARTANSPLA